MLVNRCLVLMGVAGLLAACGGKSSSSGTTSPTSYSVGGDVSGLSGTLVLQDNGGDNLSITESGAFAFATTLAPGTAYDVSILTQPVNQSCTLNNASGTLQSSISSVLVSCVSTTAVTDQWMWRSGTDSVNGAGTYGTQGSAAALNVPGARRKPSAWTDLSGNLWLFGGYGTGSAAGSDGMLNDLWEYSPTSQLWTWQGGSPYHFAIPQVWNPLAQTKWKGRSVADHDRNENGRYVKAVLRGERSCRDEG